MTKKRLQIWVPEDLHTSIVKEAGEGSITDVGEELLRLGLAQRRGETIQSESLPVIRELVQTELKKTVAQIRMEIREDMQTDILSTIKDQARRSDDRLAALIVRTVRSSGIGQRMLYSLIAKLVNPTFAQQMYETAREQVGRELSNKSGPGTGSKEGE